MTATLSKLLSSQEARDASVSIEKSPPEIWLEPEHCACSDEGPKWCDHDVGSEDEHGNHVQWIRYVRDDLVAELAAVDALRAELAEAHAGHEQHFVQWSKLQDLIQSLENQNAALRAENERMRVAFAHAEVELHYGRHSEARHTIIEALKAVTNDHVR